MRILVPAGTSFVGRAFPRGLPPEREAELAWREGLR
jgi:hypothetical protein